VRRDHLTPFPNVRTPWVGKAHPTQMTPPEVKIHVAADLPAERHAELQALFDEQFAGSSFQWAAPQFHVLTSIDGRLAASVRLFSRTIAVAGQRMHVGGVGGVMTLPERRHRGLASTTLRHAAEFIRRALKVEFALLLCRDEVTPLYATLGWQIVEGPTTFEQPTGRATYPRRTMVLTFGSAPWPHGPIDLRGLPW
jgi:aminoglycoside 2'-N-acetyltransferase I